jgi:hypothetical protein
MRLPVFLVVALAACGGASSGDDVVGDDVPGDDAPPTTVADGTLTAWRAQAAMPTPRANHCSAYVDGWVVVIGGNFRPAGSSDFVKTDEIHAARVDADGVLGAWHLAGHTPSPVTECTAMADAARLVVVDGLFDVETDGRGVWTAAIDAAGMLAPMTRIGDLPAGREVISSEGFVRDGALHLMDVELPAEDDDTLTLHATLDGGLGAWRETGWAIGFRGQPAYAFAGGFVYSLGGYVGDATNTMSPAVFAAGLDTDGALGPAFETTAMPMPIGFGEAVAVDDWVFVIGGRGQVFGAPGTTTVLAAPIGAGGALGAWGVLAALPIARTNHEVVLAGDHLVLTGGATNGPGEDVVYTARVRFASN